MNAKIALITGANKGIGLQIARDLAAHGLTVLVGSRNLEHGEAAAAEIGNNAHAIQLDVTDAASIAAAATRIRTEFGRLDILINNAGIVIQPDSVTESSLQNIRAVYETNVFGVIAVTQAMLPLLREAPSARIINVSSSLGSLTYTSDATHHHHAFAGVYSSSKSALNGVTVALAKDLESTKIKVNAADPGYTATALNNFSGPRTVEEAAREPVRLALLGDDAPTGTFTNEDGPVPW